MNYKISKQSISVKEEMIIIIISYAYMDISLFTIFLHRPLKK